MLSALPAVLTQLICHALRSQEILLLARCSRQLLHTCDSAFAFKHTPPFCVARMFSALSAVDSLSQPLLRHLTFSLLLLDNDVWFHTSTDIAPLRGLPIHTLICAFDATRIAGRPLAAPLQLLSQLRVIRCVRVGGVDRVLDRLLPLTELQLVEFTVEFELASEARVIADQFLPSLASLVRLFGRNPQLTCKFDITRIRRAGESVSSELTGLDQWQAVLKASAELSSFIDRILFRIVDVAAPRLCQ